MWWEYELPMEITLGLLAAFIVLATLLVPLLKWKWMGQWKRIWTFVFSVLLAIVIALPAFRGVLAIANSVRFGTFHYDKHADIRDPRVDWYVPAGATDIAFDKQVDEHHARFSISESELRAFLDGLWARYAQRKKMSSEELAEHRARRDSEDDSNNGFAKLGWTLPEHPLVVAGPGGDGSRYYFDPATGTAYHYAWYY
jgi:4-amino-4-deoxy-L-arabinose transferase-like glycosyltransferase